MPKINIQETGNKNQPLEQARTASLTEAVIEEFASMFAPGAKLIYVRGTGKKVAHFDRAAFDALGADIAVPVKMPDVILYDQTRNWLFLIASRAPINPRRYEELTKLFLKSNARLVYVNAFTSRPLMAKYVPDISWETVAWIADDPSHLIHFNGKRILGPY